MLHLRPAARVLYALGGFGPSLLQQTVLLWVFFFYAPPPGQPHPARATPGMVGLAMAITLSLFFFLYTLTRWSSTRTRRCYRR